MCKNELKAIEEQYLTTDQANKNAVSATDIEEVYTQVKISWENAAFSNVMEETLKRYFYYHLQGIAKCSDTLFNLYKDDRYAQKQKELLKLIDHLHVYYTPYFDLDMTAPFAYQELVVDRLGQNLVMTREQLQSTKFPLSLNSILLAWIEEITTVRQHVHFSFRTLFYFEQIIAKIAVISFETETAFEQLLTLLTRSNFNHLAFFTYRCNEIIEKLISISSTAEKIALLRQEKAIAASTPEKTDLIYDQSWPPLKAMLAGWFDREIILAEVALKKELLQNQESLYTKLQLNLPVNHLAYLIRLFYEENVLASSNLSSIFKFFSAHYESKRQPIISHGSLSKEYYSTDQQTAARIRDLLQKMIVRINRNFFPVSVAVNVVTYAFLKNH